MSEPDRIARALLTPGGHLSIGRGGYTLPDSQILNASQASTMPNIMRPSP